jgi:oligopeptide/dipeptide ABC transporter ATP-binding protein
METGTTIETFEQPRHPYTQFLLESLTMEESKRLASTEESGVDFSLSGCRFAHRCAHAFERCSSFPPLFQAGHQHLYSCFLGEEEDVVAAQRSQPA